MESVTTLQTTPAKSVRVCNEIKIAEYANGTSAAEAKAGRRVRNDSNLLQHTAGLVCNDVELMDFAVKSGTDVQLD